jgi:MFS family permease
MSLLFVALFNSILGLSLLFPILGPLGRQLGLTELQVGALSTAYSLMQLVWSPRWGRRSERIGRKPVLMMGIIGFAVSFAAFGVIAELGMRGALSRTPMWLLLVGARLVGGTFSSATMPTAQAWAADLSGREDRTAAMAVVGAAFGLGLVFGPAIGAALSTLGLLVPIYFSAGLALLNAVFVGWRLREPARRPARREGASPLLFSDPRVWPLLAVGTGITLASAAMEQSIAFYFQDRLGLTPQDTPRYVGIALVLYGGMAAVAQGMLVRRFRWTPQTLMRAGLPLAIVAFSMLVFAHRYGMLLATVGLLGLGQGLVMPGVSSALSLSVLDDEQGPVAGFNSSAQALGRMLGPVIGTGLYEVRPHYPYVFSATLLCAIFVVVMAIPRIAAVAKETQRG